MRLSEFINQLLSIEMEYDGNLEVFSCHGASGGDPEFPEAFFKFNESVWVLIKPMFIDGEFHDVLIYAWRNKPTLDELAKDAGLSDKPYSYLKGIMEFTTATDYILKEFKRGEKGSVN